MVVAESELNIDDIALVEMSIGPVFVVVVELDVLPWFEFVVKTAQSLDPG